MCQGNATICPDEKERELYMTFLAYGTNKAVFDVLGISDEKALLIVGHQSPVISQKKPLKDKKRLPQRRTRF